MSYQLIAFDMDGTLLTTDKKISPKTTEAVRMAEDAGKTVILATGRSRNELVFYTDTIRYMSYAILESGGVLYDLKAGEILDSCPLKREEIQSIIDLSLQEDVMIQIMAEGTMYLPEGSLSRLAHYHTAHFQELFDKTAVLLPDIRGFALSGSTKIEKINLYHTDTEARERTMKRAVNVDLEKVYSEITSIEFTPHGVSKGAMLESLCRRLGLTTEQTIAVGDADNDLVLLNTAGLAVAMGNANDHVKAAAGVIVADNDHDGCAEAIERYLL